jgi:hypothetical protein
MSKKYRSAALVQVDCRHAAKPGWPWYAMLVCAAAAAPTAHCGDSATTPVPGSAITKLSEQKPARLMPGVSTKAQVLALLGAPWRTVQYNDMEELENEIWEYRGMDSNGGYRIHIEFDHHDIVQIVGKIPDKTVDGKGTIVKSAPSN